MDRTSDKAHDKSGEKGEGKVHESKAHEGMGVVHEVKAHESTTEKKVSQEEWWKKIREVSEANQRKGEVHHESHSEVKGKVKQRSENAVNKFSRNVFFISLGLFLIAFVVRFYFIFFVTDPQNAGVGWYNDSYHHWQIAYLTKEIGLGNSFLRLWDLTGMEYFWGFLQPILLTILYTITGTADILVSRLMNSFIGSLSVVFLFLLTRKYFNWQAGVGAALIAIFNPVGIFTDTSGMQEPLAILMMLIGIFLWPERPFFTGFFLFLASLSRAEYWVFAIILMLVLLIFDKRNDKKLVLGISYFGPILLYLKYLLDKTGNAIYPIYWNFMGNAAGEWQADIPLTQQQEMIRLVFLVILVIFVIVGIYLVWKKPRLYIFSLLGVGNFMFLSLFVGFTEYLKSYLPRFWVDRIFWMPYLWLGFVVAVVVLYFLPRYVRYVGGIVGWAVVVGVVVVLQFVWAPINTYRAGGDNYLNTRSEMAAEIVAFYKGGSVLIPGNDAILDYELYKNGIPGKAFRGEMFDPYFYFTEADPYEKWAKKNRRVVLDWLKREDIKLLVFDQNTERYAELVKREPDRFVKLGHVDQLEIYEVK